MKRFIVPLVTLFVAALTAPDVSAFCGFYVAKADSKLFNRASQVVLVRQDDKTVITMANDFKGDLKEFAIVVPVPTVLEKGQIRVGERAVIEHLDAYTAPRLVEYFDGDPCAPRVQMAFESPKFMLPIRLGTLNADGPQELFVYALTRKGRVETTNYRTVRLPTGTALPVHVKEEFPQFYRAMFAQQVKREDMRAVFLEYAWDMGWCDPCAADPLSVEELRKLGVFWLPETGTGDALKRRGGPVDVFVTRLHVGYDSAHFPEDLVFQETADRTNFQGRYVLRHAWKGEARCDAAQRYYESLRVRTEQEVRNLASLTGWPVEEIRKKVGPLPGNGSKGEPRKWWERIFRE